MLLLALAMITFWDSSFLPQGAACGSWEKQYLYRFAKDALEELTWMLFRRTSRFRGNLGAVEKNRF